MRWRNRLGLIAAIAGLAGCAVAVPLVPANPQAAAIGSPKLRYVPGLPAAPMNITMPDGSVLPGDVVIDETSAAPVVAQGGPAEYFGLAGGNFRVTAHNAQTAIACRALLVAGHGSGLCRDQNGSLYDIAI